MQVSHVEKTSGFTLVHVYEVQDNVGHEAPNQEETASSLRFSELILDHCSATRGRIRTLMSQTVPKGCWFESPLSLSWPLCR